MIRSSLRVVLGALLVAVALLAVMPRSTFGAAAQGADGRVIVLGFDGADARTVKLLTEADPEAFPTFQRLMDTGTFAPMLVEAPPESPVAWAALNTGQNPGKTGVPGFIKVARTHPGTGADVAPFASFGHLEMEPGALEDFENVPIPTWDAGKLAGALGGAAFVLVLLVTAVVLKMNAAIAVVLALLLGGGAGFGGYLLRGQLADSYPRMGNPLKVQNFWDHAAEAGKRSVVLNAAQAWDKPSPEGAEVLGGLGLPDAKNGIGEWAIYTTNPSEFQRPPQGNSTNTAGVVYRVDESAGEIVSEIYGPDNFWLISKLEQEIARVAERQVDPSIKIEDSIALADKERLLGDELAAAKDKPTSVPLTIRKGASQGVAAGSAEVTIGDQSQMLAEGEWSDFYELTFKLNNILEVHALTRVKLVHLDDPYFELFVNVLDIDPRKPPFWQAISTPFEFSNELAMRCGLYETYGWPTATMPLKDEAIEPVTLMEDVEFTLKWRERLLEDQLRRDDWDCLFAVFSTTDRVQHMMYQFWDEGHPLHDPAEADTEFEFFGETIRYRDAIPKTYEQMDRIVGRVLDEEVQPNDTLLVVADHGFQTFRYQVNLNNWLIENGYAALKPGLTAGSSPNDWADWPNTRVYSLGMGFLYVNLQGREKDGIVAPDEVDELLAQLQADLLESRDPERDRPLFNEVYVTKEIHSGKYLGEEGDMLVGFAPEYRVAWNGTGGGVKLQRQDGVTVLGPMIYDNDSHWSGGHVSVALPDVAAVFFSNRKVQPPAGDEQFRSLHIAPTALDLMGVPVPAEMDLQPLRFE